MTFEVLRNHEDYEILNEYPHTIRRKSDGLVISEWFDKQGYVAIKLNQKHYLKHRIIAEQFIENDDPDTKTQVDHINHDRSDNRIQNLRWVSASDNCKNRSCFKGVEYTFSDDIPDESIMITDYQTTRGMKYFDDNRYYYFHDDETDEDLFFAKVKDDYYKRLHINVSKSGIRFISLVDVNNKRVQLCINKFKHQYDL